MSEAEILEHLFSLYDRYWVIVQWWASVSFGLIAVAHLASNKLNLFLLLAILALYTAYSLWLYFFLEYNLGIMFGLFEELSLLLDAEEITEGGRQVLEHPSGPYGLMFGRAALPITFFACSSYLVHSYAHARKST